MAQLVKLAGVQMDVTLGQVDENLAKIEAYLRQTSAAGAVLTVFPECALTGYCFKDLAEARVHAQPIPGPATERLGLLCRSLGTYTIFGMLELDGPRVFNATVLVGPAGLIGSYRKIHLPYLGVDRFTTPGDRPLEVFTCGPLKVGMNICYDGSFPESARCMALAGADLIALPTNWPPGGESTADYIINARAIENQVYYLAVNRVGDERGFHFIGKSRLASPNGGDIAAALHDRETIVYGEIDPAVARNKHLVRVPGEHEIHRFKDRRPELYGRITAPIDKSPDDEDPDGEKPDERGAALRQQLWAPWRLDYIKERLADPSAKAKPAASGEECFICQGQASDQDRENLIVHRGPLTLSILNRFPYNNGHLLIAPRAHKARLEELSADEHLECMQEVTRVVGVLQRGLNAEGFNVGLNLGRVAGAGVPGHLHWHIVPRWHGDTNFMASLAGIRVIPQSLDALWQFLSER